MQNMTTEPQSLGSHYYFHRKLLTNITKIQKSITNTDLFEDGGSNSISNAQTFLPHLVVEPETDSHSFHTRTALTGLGPLNETQLTPKKQKKREQDKKMQAKSSCCILQRSKLGVTCKLTSTFFTWIKGFLALMESC